MIDFTEDEIACLKKMIYKFRQDEILELYNKMTKEIDVPYVEGMYITTVSGCLTHAQVPKPKSFLVKAKDAIVNFFINKSRIY